MATLRTPRGPGRIRLDERDDVLFASTPFDVSAGDRVMVAGVHRSTKRPPAWMFGSRLRVEAVLRYPDVDWKAFRAKPDPAASVRNALAKKAGKAILGKWSYEDEGWRFPRDVEPGALIFSYEKGVHRFLRLSGTKRGGMYVLSEPVLTSKLQRTSYPPMDCIEHFCKPVPASLAKEIGRIFAL